jgi:raffinose/stachyose/melibiose transport system permease protein
LAIVNVTVILGPSLASIAFAFTDWTGLGSAHLIGIDNFTRLAADPDFRDALMHNLIWTVIFMTVPVAMGLLGAFVLSKLQRFQLFFRIAYFAPYVIASVVSAGIWENILDPNQGLGATLGQLGLPIIKDTAFFGDPDLALLSVAFVNNWAWWGFLVVVFLAAMQAVNPDLYEAARVDGATTTQEFRHITLPMILPTVVFMMVMTIVWSFLVFDYVWIITQGGPAGSTEVVATLLYRTAFERREAGYAAAMGLILSLVGVIAVSGFFYLRRRGWEV